jgi:hypothetical protein
VIMTARLRASPSAAVCRLVNLFDFHASQLLSNVSSTVSIVAAGPQRQRRTASRPRSATCALLRFGFGLRPLVIKKKKIKQCIEQ